MKTYFLQQGQREKVFLGRAPQLGGQSAHSLDCTLNTLDAKSIHLGAQRH